RCRLLWIHGAVHAAASEDDLGRVYREPLGYWRGEQDTGKLVVQVLDPTADLAHKVMVRFEIRVEPGRSGAEVQRGQLPQRREIVEGLVDGPQRDHGQLGAHGRMDALRRVVVGGMGQYPEDRVPLRGHPEAPAAE